MTGWERKRRVHKLGEAGQAETKDQYARESAICWGIVAVAIVFMVVWGISHRHKSVGAETVNGVPVENRRMATDPVSPSMAQQTVGSARPSIAIVPTTGPTPDPKVDTTVEVIETDPNAPVKATSSAATSAPVRIAPVASAVAPAGPRPVPRARVGERVPSGVRPHAASPSRVPSSKGRAEIAHAEHADRVSSPKPTSQPLNEASPPSPSLSTERPHVELDPGGKRFHSVYPKR